MRGLPLGYPISDEIDTYDGLAKVSKFQGGQLIWRPWTNKVTAVMTTELPLDLPTPTGEVWQVIQANAVNDGDSHGGTFAYCYDFAAANGETKDKPLLSTANARVVQVLQGSDISTQSNVVVQHLGLGRYASSLHIAKSSFAETFGKGKAALTLATPWPARPIAKTGDTIAKVGKTGTGGEHIHFCVTTAPDGTVFTPFESVPMTFRNFESSADGVTCNKVSTGRPRAGIFVRHSAALNPSSPASLVGGEKLLNFGGVSGALKRFGGKPWLDGSVVVRAVSGWGEPLGSAVTVPLSAAGGSAPFKYTLPAIPNFPLIHVEATFIGAKLQPKLLIAKGDSKVITVVANTDNVADVTIPF